MSALRVGARARFARANSEEGRRHIGEVVTLIEADVYSGNLERFDWAVRNERGEQGCVNAWQLDPILYDGNQLVSWSECAWQPEGVSA